MRPINQPYGNIRINYYEAATGTAMYRFHPADLDANGRVVLATPGSNNYIVGSIVGFLDDAYGPISDDYSGYLPANPASTNSAGVVNVAVADDPGQFFVIEEDTGGTALDAQAVNAGASFTYLASTGSTVSGIANVVLDRSTVGTGSNQQLRLIGKWDKQDNAFGNYCKWIVSVYLHRFNPPTPTNGTTTLV